MRASLVALAALAACTPAADDATRSTEFAAPAPTDSIVGLQLAQDGARGVLASWMQPLAGGGYAFRVSRLEGETWSAPRTIVAQPDLQVHATDLPSVVRLDDGALAAVWQQRGGAKTSARAQYGFRVAFSRDEGATWSAPVIPHPGSTEGGEHEFHVAWPAADGGLRMAWIDPRAQAIRPDPATPTKNLYRGAMMLVSTRIGADGVVAPETVVDSVMCECCPNAAVRVGDEVLVAYRDKRFDDPAVTTTEGYDQPVLRDLSLARFDGTQWTAGQRLTEDDWHFDGCPNNGPSLAATGPRVAVAWWTAEGDRPRVQVRFSDDAGRTFGAPVRADSGRAEGQVSVALAGDDAVVLWLERRRVHQRVVRADGTAGPITVLGDAVGRHRLPAMVPLADGRLLSGWVGPQGRMQLRTLAVAK